MVLRFATDMAYGEIGEMLDCSEDAAARNVHEGLKKLRGEFADMKLTEKDTGARAARARRRARTLERADAGAARPRREARA